MRSSGRTSPEMDVVVLWSSATNARVIAFLLLTGSISCIGYGAKHEVALLVVGPEQRRSCRVRDLGSG